MCVDRDRGLRGGGLGAEAAGGRFRAREWQGRRFRDRERLGAVGEGSGRNANRGRGWQRGLAGEVLGQGVAGGDWGQGMVESGAVDGVEGGVAIGQSHLSVLEKFSGPLPSQRRGQHSPHQAKE